MKKHIFFTGIAGLLMLVTVKVSAQVGINSENNPPDPSAMLDVQSTSKGVLVPRMTSAQRTGIVNPVPGLLVYDNTTSSYWFYNGNTWNNLSAATGSAWLLSGNTGTTAGTHFLGTTDNVPLTFKIDNLTAGKIEPFNTALGLRALYSNTTGSAILPSEPVHCTAIPSGEN